MITYQTRKYYGRKRHYLIDEDKQKAFYKLTGRRTLSDKDIIHLQALGVEFNQDVQPINQPTV